MILNFEEFRKTNESGHDLDKIRVKNFDIFQKKGLPSKKEENWKYTDLKTIIKNSLNKLEILNEKTLQYNHEWLIKNFDHNQIILLNGNFVKSNFNFEDEKKIKINPLKNVLKDKKYFDKLKDFFVGQKNSLEIKPCAS